MADKVDSTSTDAAMQFSDRGSSPSILRKFLELIRFSHTVFALPFAALACAFSLAVPPASEILSSGEVGLRLLGVLLCMVAARSAAMALNRLVDARIDAANPRTASRHIPSGLLSTGQVWTFFIAASLLFVGSCLLFLPNWLPLAFSLPVLAWICGYSFAKRFTSAAHLWLGVALALSPICAWIAIRGEIVQGQPSDVLPACGLALAIALWVAGFDIIYACQDADFDRKAGLRSIPAKWGVAKALRISAAFHFVMLGVLGILPTVFPQLSLGWLYYFALAAVSALVVWQHSLVRPEDLGRVNLAFFHVNATISFGLSVVAAIDTFVR